MHSMLDFSKRNACRVFSRVIALRVMHASRADSRVTESESFPRFFDKKQQIRLALFFEMLTMTLIMGFMIIKFVKLKQPSRVGN